VCCCTREQRLDSRETAEIASIAVNLPFSPAQTFPRPASAHNYPIV